MAEESAAARFTRDWGTQPDGDATGGRKDRGLNNQSLERAGRLYVNREDGTTPADDENVNN